MTNVTEPSSNSIFGWKGEEQFHKSDESISDSYYINYYVYIKSVKTILTQLRRFPNSTFQHCKNHHEEQINEFKESLYLSDYKYAHLSDYRDPFELLKYMDSCEEKFDEDFCVYQWEGGLEIYGGLLGSERFACRFFCRETLDKWIKQAKLIDPLKDYSIQPSS